MHTKNPLFDEFARLTTGAMGLAQTAGDEAKAAMRAQADKIAVEFDLVRKDELEALRAEIAALRAEVQALKETPKTGTARKAARPKDAAG